MLIWNVDNIKASYDYSKVNTRFTKQVKDAYGSNELGHVKVTRRKRHNYIDVFLDCNKEEKLKVDTEYCINNIVNEFSEELKLKRKILQNNSLFKVNEKSPTLDKERANTFYSFEIKRIFLVKRARSNLEPSFVFLSTRVKYSKEKDESKLVKMMNYLKVIKKDIFTLRANNIVNLC